MIKEISYSDINSHIKSNQNIIITTHLNPDGDAIGSSTALNHYLRSIGKNSRIINHDPTPKNLQFLDNGLIEIFEEDQHKNDFKNAELIFVLDLNDAKRLKSIGDVLGETNATIIVIDHHLEPKEFADFYKIDLEKASTCELVYELIENANGTLTTEIANSIYTGILTDTGSFRFDRTTARTFEIASKLCEAGVKPERIYDYIMNSNSLPGYKLYGKVLSGIEIYGDGLIGVLTVLESDYEQTGGTKEDLEGIASSPLSIEGVNIALLLTESKEKNELKGSLRSKNGYNIREVAASFGGGGHAYASGFRVEADLSIDELKDQVIEKLLKL